jgi:diketogulonate reductase-like aldo/keto reductase
MPAMQTRPILIPGVRLNNGVEIPALGLGVYQSAPGRETRQAVEWALELGYRHIDTASAYGNEGDVGAAVRSSGIPRAQVFVTTKLFNPDHGYDHTLRAFDASLARLGFDTIDLYLIHWPVENLRLDTWRAFERLYHEQRVRSIGVSNYMVRHLQELLANCDVKPAVNQIELHPFIFAKRADTVAFCQQQDIGVEAYSPLTKARRLDHPVVTRIARALDRTPAQVLIRYCLDKDTVVLPKSAHKRRIQENANVFDFQLTPDQLAELDALDEGLATGWDPTDAP